MTYSKSITKTVKDRLKKAKKAVKFYKTLIKEDGTLRSPVLNNYKWKQGLNVSNRGISQGTKVSKDEKKFGVGLGFHVFLKYQDAKNELYIDHVIVPVYCKLEDFVGAGWWIQPTKSAVFTKVTLKKEDYNRAIKGKSI